MSGAADVRLVEGPEAVLTPGRRPFFANERLLDAQAR